MALTRADKIASGDDVLLQKAIEPQRSKLS
jgi:hypothetical protein